MNMIQPRWWLALRRLLIIGGALMILVSLARWGGTARPGPLFTVGVVVFSSLVLAFGAIIVWIFHGPQIKNIPGRSAAFRQTIATLSLTSCTVFTSGFFWDEVWHRRYGGFGNDFFWPPHLLIYTSFGLFTLLSLGGLWITFRGQGYLRERLRSESYISLLGLVTGFLCTSALSDELWHRIYGKDITSWSIPHITLAGGVVFVSLIAAILAQSLERRSKWQVLTSVRLPDCLAVPLMSVGTVVLLQFGTSEWEGITRLQPEGDIFRDAFWLRPVWLYPVIVTAIGLFIGNFALHSTRLIGSATLVALGVIVFRLTSLMILGVEAQKLHIGYTSHLLPLIPAVLLDAWYYWSRHRLNNPLTLHIGNLLAVGGLLLIGLPFVKQTMIYPPITTLTVSGMVVRSIIMALIAGWAGRQFSEWLMSLSPPMTPSPINLRAIFLTIGGLAATLTLVLTALLLSNAPV